MEIIFLIGGILSGFISGILWQIISDNRYKTYGIIDIDHNTAQCKIHITSEELANRKTKKAIFTINHDAIISRSKQRL